MMFGLDCHLMALRHMYINGRMVNLVLGQTGHPVNQMQKHLTSVSGLNVMKITATQHVTVVKSMTICVHVSSF